MPLTTEVLQRCGVPPKTARANLPLMISAMREFGITTPDRARMFLAQVLHESMRFTRFEEIGSGAQYEGNKSLGNTEPGDGVRFKGRGPIQITGRWNYTHFGKLVGLDLVRRPELAAAPRHGWRLAAAYFEDRGCNDAADRGDFREVTRLINAGMAHFEERRKFYELLSKVDVVPARKQDRRTAGDKRDRRTAGDKRDRRTERDKRDRRTERNKRNRGRAERTVSAPPRSKPRTMLDVVAEFKRLEAQSERTWDRLAAQGKQRRRSVTAARAVARDEVGAILLRIEDKLEALLELERGTSAITSSQPAPALPSAVPSPSGNGAGQDPTGVDRCVDVSDLSDAKIVQRIEELEVAIGRSRAALMRRYLDADKELARSGAGAERTRRVKPARDKGVKG